MKTEKPLDVDTLAEILKAVIKNRHITKNIDAIETVDLVIDLLKSQNLLAMPKPEKPAVAKPGADVLVPAVPIEDSVQPEYLICLEDGKRMRMLKRHLRNKYGMSVEEYRAKWGLPADYPSFVLSDMPTKALIERQRKLR